MTAPARRILEEADARNAELGHDNLGSLSYARGFLPRGEPLRHLPASHKPWDEIADSLPELYRTYSVRRTIGEMPILSAAEADLPEADVLRASSLLSILAHLYWYAEPEPPEGGIPPQIQRPWNEITRRLVRPAPHLSFIDLNSHNWRFIDPEVAQPFVVENLRLAIPLVGNEEERRFQTTPIEMLYLFAPMIEPMLAAQEASMRDDPGALKTALASIGDSIRHLTYVSLQKVNPNPYSDQYINPVVWGKTTAPFASPFQKESIPGPSGTAIPSFTAMDIFFGRKKYHTTVGHETNRTRDWFPRHWREWLDALETVSVTDYVVRKGDRELAGIYEETRGAYAGESGLLSRHRLKAYGFLDLSFKAGRLKTLGGVSGSYSERVWDRMATELNESRLERYGTRPETTHFVPVKRVEVLYQREPESVRRIVFDIAGTGIRYQPGDRCGILPENGDELVEKTLRALHARGSEMIQLSPAWRWYVNLRDGHQGATELPLRTLLRFGRIRPLDRSTALALQVASNNPHLEEILDAWAEDQWELWDVLGLLAEAGYNPRRLWKAIPGDQEHICRIVPPESWRLYSISSAMADGGDELHLTVGGLQYRTDEGAVSQGGSRRGTGSSFLGSLGEAPARTVSIKVVHPPRFSLPADAARPIVMFAGGTGIAPMRGLIAERMKQEGGGPAWLFFGTRDREQLLYRDELAPFLAAGKLELRVAFSRDDVAARFDRDAGKIELVPGARRRLDEEIVDEENARLLWDLLRSREEGGQGAYFYVCGRTAFASSVIAAIKKVIARYRPGDAGRDFLYRLMGEDRFMQEIFTTYEGTHRERQQGYHVSDVVLHNDDERGYWIVISGRVYDVTEFNHIHPGGAKIIQSYAGMDGTVAYQKVDHHVNPEIDAMLGMYALGVVRAPELGQHWGVALSKKGLRPVTLRSAYRAWVDLLYMVVEIENAVASDLRVRNEPLTDIETAAGPSLTPAKVQQITSTHERLVTGYLDHLLGEPIETLWAVTVGIVERGDLDARWMGQRLGAARSAPTASMACRMAVEIRAHLKDDPGRAGAAPEIELRYGSLCDRLAHEDRRVLGELKAALREGVMVFEELGAATLRSGGDRLVGCLERVPSLLEGFYARVTDGQLPR